MSEFNICFHFPVAEQTVASILRPDLRLTGIQKRFSTWRISLIEQPRHCWGMSRILWAIFSFHWWILANSLPGRVRITFHLINLAPVSETIPFNKSIGWDVFVLVLSIFHQSCPVAPSGSTFIFFCQSRNVAFNIHASVFFGFTSCF